MLVELCLKAPSGQQDSDTPTDSAPTGEPFSKIILCCPSGGRKDVFTWYFGPLGRLAKVSGHFSGKKIYLAK